MIAKLKQTVRRDTREAQVLLALPARRVVWIGPLDRRTAYVAAALAVARGEGCEVNRRRLAGF